MLCIILLALKNAIKLGTAVAPVSPTKNLKLHKTRKLKANVMPAMLSDNLGLKGGSLS